MLLMVPNVSWAFEAQQLPGVKVGSFSVDGYRYFLRMVQGKTEEMYDQVLLYDPSEIPIGTLAYKRYFDASHILIIENPFPMVVEEASLDQFTATDLLYAGLFLHLLQSEPDAVREGLQIDFTDVRSGVAHPTITLPLKKFGFEAVGGHVMTIPVQTAPVVQEKMGVHRVETSSHQSVTFELSNHYKLSNLLQLHLALARMVAGSGGM